MQSTSGAGERVNITPWRHQRQSGGIIVDMGIHYTDLLEFYLGPIERVMGMSDQIDSQRVDTDGVWHPVDAEDLSVGVARFASGAIANWMMNRAGRGETHFTRILYGTQGSLAIPRDRSGHPLGLMVRRDGKDETMPQAGAPRRSSRISRLDATTAALFGGDRLSSYTMAFNDIDANLLAIELADFADAIADRSRARGDRNRRAAGIGGGLWLPRVRAIRRARSSSTASCRARSRRTSATSRRRAVTGLGRDSMDYASYGKTVAAGFPA